MIRFEVPGQPKAKGRPRFARRGAHVVTYTDDATASYEQMVGLLGRQAHDGPPLSVPCRVEFVAVFERPGRLNRKKDPPGRVPMDSKAAGTDLDNIAKALLDGLMRGGVLADDKLVVELVCRKVYAAKGEAAHTAVVVQPDADPLNAPF